jgi:hypothetical protein
MFLSFAYQNDIRPPDVPTPVGFDVGDSSYPTRREGVTRTTQLACHPPEDASGEIAAHIRTPDPNV